MTIYITATYFPQKDLHDTLGESYYASLEDARDALSVDAEDRLAEIADEDYPESLEDCKVELETDGFSEVYRAVDPSNEVIFVAWIKQFQTN